MSGEKKKIDPAIWAAVIGGIFVLLAAIIERPRNSATAATTPTLTPSPIATPSIVPTDVPTEPAQELPPEDFAYPVWRPAVAVFSAVFDAGNSWRIGETYTYNLQVEDCGSDKYNFTGPTNTFTVPLDRSLYDRFYLLDDGLYSHWVKNQAERIEADAFIDSNAIVAFFTNTAEEADELLKSCEASIVINGSPPLRLEPDREGATLADSAGMFDIDVASFPPMDVP